MALIDLGTPEARQIAQNFNSLRGGYVNSFAQTEYLIGKLLQALVEEGVLDNECFPWPKPVEKRVSTLILALKENPKLEPFMEKGLDVLTGFQNTIDGRHFLVHGFAKLRIEDMVAEIRKFTPNREDTWNEEVIEIDLNALPEQCEIFEIIAKTIFDLVFEISDQLGLGLKSDHDT